MKTNSRHIITEPIGPYERHIHDIERTVVSGQTALQHFEIVELFGYGPSLILDGRVQSTARDEAIYHEALLYPAYCLKQVVKRVLVLGGANGGMLHRLRNLPNLKEVVQIDVDPELLPITRKHLPHMHRAVESDSRMHVSFGDPRTLLSSLSGPFDLAICDLPDAIEGSRTTSLFTSEFYRDIKRLLNGTGVLATQAGPANFLDAAFFASVLSTTRSVFLYAEPYSITVPSFGIPWGFVVASDNIVPSSLTESTIERCIDQLFEQPFCYDLATHRHLFSLPRHIRRALDSHGQVSSDKEPIYVTS